MAAEFKLSVSQETREDGMGLGKCKLLCTLTINGEETNRHEHEYDTVSEAAILAVHLVKVFKKSTLDTNTQISVLDLLSGMSNLQN